MLEIVERTAAGCSRRTWRGAPICDGGLGAVIFIAVEYAMATGLFFGVYPTQRAARPGPIDAPQNECGKKGWKRCVAERQ